MLRASAATIIVTPSMVDNNESQRGALTIITEAPPLRKVFRGIVESIGRDVADREDVHIGDVAHYSDFTEVDGFHIVPIQNLLAFDA